MNYKKMKKNELRDICTGRGIKTTTKTTNAALCALLDDHDRAVKAQSHGRMARLQARRSRQGRRSYRVR